MIANANRGKSDKSFTPKDFLPDWDQPPGDDGGEQTPEQQLAVLRAYTAAADRRTSRRVAKS